MQGSKWLIPRWLEGCNRGPIKPYPGIEGPFEAVPKQYALEGSGVAPLLPDVAHQYIEAAEAPTAHRGRRRRYKEQEAQELPSTPWKSTKHWS